MLSKIKKAIKNPERAVACFLRLVRLIAKLLGEIIGKERIFILVKRLTNAILEGNGFSLRDLIPSSSDQIILLKKYNFAIIIDRNDRALAEDLIQFHAHEANVTRVLFRYLKQDICFLDIGANIGYYSLLVASQCPEAKIFSFEPDKKNFHLFKTSIFYNSYDKQIEAFPFAVSDKDETILVSDLGNNPNFGARFTGKTLKHLKSLVHGPAPYFAPVKAVKLDSFLENQRIDLIKIDIEGYEPFAIKGMINIIKRNRPVIISEFAPSNLKSVGQRSPEEYLNIFISLGYRLNVIDQNGSVLPFEQKISDLIQYHSDFNTHHLDLLIT